MDPQDYAALMRAFTDSVERGANGGYSSTRVQPDGTVTDDIETLTKEVQLAILSEHYAVLLREYDDIQAEMLAIAADLMEAIARSLEKQEGDEGDAGR